MCDGQRGNIQHTLYPQLGPYRNATILLNLLNLFLFSIVNPSSYATFGRSTSLSEPLSPRRDERLPTSLHP
jgi:hypothetical protein